MKKIFKLPKEFALKWIEALRSGNYKQGFGELALSKDVYENDILVESNLENTKFCCLGVAGNLCGYKISNLTNVCYLNGFEKVPEEIAGVAFENSLVYVLTNFNDGTVTNLDIKNLINEGYILRSNKNQLNFSEIADFIEDNVEFY